MTSSRHAADVLAKFWDNVLPVNLLDIASKLGITVAAAPNLGNTSGHYSPTGWQGGPLITYNPSENIVRQRFTIAHEIGHHVLEHGESDRDTPRQFMTRQSNPNEYAANIFAAELLMPEDAVKAMIQVRGITNLYELSGIFNVSDTAMRIRLERLGYNVK